MRDQLVAGIKAALQPVLRQRKRLERSRYAGTPILGWQAGNDRIAQLLAAGRPAAIGKMGASELGALKRYESRKGTDGLCQSWGPHAARLHVNAGVYPADPAIFSRFCQLFGRCLGDLDVLAVWFHLGENRLRQKFAPSADLMELESLDPFFHDHPWSSQLAGKRVVVVTPFATTINDQYARRRDVWRAKPEVLPDFELRTVRCPLSAGLADPQHPDWFAALDAIIAEVDAAPYDAAIVGAGAWGVPLVSHAKRTGHWAIHLGGPTQILFGVRGGRWDNHPTLSRFYTDAWVRPGEADRPTRFRAVENGCYW